jgi:hypothetical protein
MPRTVVPPVGFRSGRSGAVGGDDYLEKLAKYVPAEALAFFVPLSGIVGDSRPTLLWIVLVVGAVGTVGCCRWHSTTTRTLSDVDRLTRLFHRKANAVMVHLFPGRCQKIKTTYIAKSKQVYQNVGGLMGKPFPERGVLQFAANLDIGHPLQLGQ